MFSSVFFLVSFLIGTGAGVIISRLLYKHTHVPLADLQVVNTQLQQAATQNAILQNSLNNTTAEKTEWQQQHNATLAQWQAATVELAALKKELEYSREKLETQKAELENIGQKFEAQFRALAAGILEDKAQKFGEQQEQGLKAILEPLKQNIQTFKQEFETKFLTETQDRSTLKEQIKQMMAMNRLLTDQANNLTEALRGSNKQQGNWGEMILERILEHTGLQKNTHYYVQQRTQNAEGQVIQPDVIVRYPDSRAMVIDSKVSLVHYEQYCSATDDESRNQCLALMLRSLRGHIDGLSGKAYHDVKDALDMVIMFVPVEGAFITAMQADSALWQYAYSKRVVLISPTNLIAVMKLVSDMWQRDGIDKNAQRIATLAGKLYDKLVGYVDSLNTIDYHIGKAHDSWQSAYKQLSTGRGNAISLVTQMKSLHAATGKSLPSAMVDEALLEDDISMPENES